MFALTGPRQRAAVVTLIAFHIFIVIASNYLVQFPMQLFGWQTTWGAFSFPFIFLATDLTVRLLGKQPARRVIAYVMLPALLASYAISVLFQEGIFRGAAALLVFNSFILRISLASFAAYAVGQLADIQVFDRLRQLKQWWIAPTASTVLGNLLDTFVFFSVAFWYSSNAFMAANWVEIAVVDYIIKILISLLLFIPLYGLLLSALLRFMGAPATAKPSI
ncbi:7-cyano-7-deazaguanine/7-aminomethyl-7-deazaguanine transporter [Denitrificimonas caeni]|uniref:Probable queuosine precursor transporter n=1 Tax=Denitrificimonas caeni TaxID=521720 RepID=A0AAE9VT57_9GAMM|nr:7-cyano-7-deazaguanine/7-aminomethyl-7-deazaguanine transporter [Denitrificimonas caeni]NLJ11642.1 7-cyano-7-deazaguanine/7-aminomethyl-7-deazaguanine transporter [Gammaproteobacteria bacterium]WBE25925.1 7-cyano-7-deazaguanine/7-aminomethyl-7-deazaguanine transporter [Denitrificimonas caeni]